MKMVTRVSPKMLTRVAKTPGSCPMVNYDTISRTMTIMMAPPQSRPIRMPFMMSDSFIFLVKENSPESSYSCAKGRMSQQRKKFM